MTENHLITPPPELVEQWECEYHHMTYGPDLSMFISEKAARWGADQELEACINAILDYPGFEHPELFVEILRAARRPKPPSLKELAIQALDEAVYIADDIPPEGISTDQADIIRRALEALPD